MTHSTTPLSKFKEWPVGESLQNTPTCETITEVLSFIQMFATRDDITGCGNDSDAGTGPSI